MAKTYLQKRFVQYRLLIRWYN